MWRRWCGIITIIVAANVALFGKAVFTGGSIVPAAVLYERDGMYVQTEQAAELDENKTLFDLLFQMYPWTTFTWDSLKQGNLPIWNPYTLAGVPFLANPQTSVFEFTKLLAYVGQVSASNLMLFSSIITLCLAGLFTYGFAKSALKLSTQAALVSAVVYAWSGPMLVWVGYPLAAIAMWLPLLLLASHQYVVNEDRKWGVVLVLAVLFQFLAGNPQISLILLVVTVAYTMMASWRTTHSWHRVAWFSVAVGVGSILALPQLIPAYQYIQQSIASELGRSGVANVSFWEALISGKWFTWHTWDDVKQFVYNLELLVFPNLHGNPSIGKYFNWKYTNYNEAAIYVGVVALWLTSLVLWQTIWKRQRQVVFWLITTIGSILVALQFPGVYLVQYLPIVNLVSLDRLRFVAVFGMAVLAGYGLDTLCTLLTQRSKQIWWLGLSTLTMIIGSILIVTKLRYTNNEQFFKQFWGGEVWLLIILSVFIIALLCMGYLRPKLANWVTAAMVVLVCAELFNYGYTYHPVVDKAQVYAKTEAVTFLQQHLGTYRITSYKHTPDSFASTLIPNSSLVWKLADVRGYEVLMPRRFELLQQTLAGGDARIAYKEFNQKWFDILGVKYIVQTKGDPEIKELKTIPTLQQAYQANGVTIFENTHVLPRAFVVFSAVTVPDAETALATMQSSALDPSTVAVMETSTEQPLTENDPRPLVPAEIVMYEPNRVVIHSTTTTNGLLVLTDSYYETWQATVDGEPVQIYPTNVAFRGVLVPAGEHTIEFKTSLF